VHAAVGIELKNLGGKVAADERGGNNTRGVISVTANMIRKDERETPEDYLDAKGFVNTKPITRNGRAPQ